MTLLAMTPIECFFAMTVLSTTTTTLYASTQPHDNPLGRSRWELALSGCFWMCWCNNPFSSSAPKPIENGNDLYCPISQELMRDPVELGKTGHVFERENIEKWLRIKKTDPMTNLSCAGDEALTPRKDIRERIASMGMSHG